MRQLENHMLARLGYVSDDIETMTKTVNDVVADLSMLNTKVGGNTGSPFTPDTILNRYSLDSSPCALVVHSRLSSFYTNTPLTAHRAHAALHET